MFNYKTAAYVIPLVAVSMVFSIQVFAQKGRNGASGAMRLGLPNTPTAPKQQPSAAPMEIYFSRPGSNLNNDQEAISNLIKAVTQGMQTDANSPGIITAFGDPLRSAKSAAFTQNNYSEQSKSTPVPGGDIDSYLSPYVGDDGPLTPTRDGKRPDDPNKKQTIGYVDHTLYYYGSPSGASGASTGLAVATIRTYADGATQLNPRVAATPVPAAVYLLGSGLLGLVGIRRKMAAQEEDYHEI